MANIFIHETAEISDKALIGEGTKIWNWVQIRECAKIGKDCVIAKGAHIDHHVKIGDKVKIQNNVSIFFNSIIEGGVQIGPHVCFTNDKMPRAVNPDLTLKSSGTKAEDWEILKTIVKEGASIGANSTLLPGITIGKWALIGAGSVITKDVPDYGLVYGNPAKLCGYVCKCGKKLSGKRKFCQECKIDFDQIIKAIKNA